MFHYAVKFTGRNSQPLDHHFFAVNHTIFFSFDTATPANLFGPYRVKHASQEEFLVRASHCP